MFFGSEKFMTVYRCKIYKWLKAPSDFGIWENIDFICITLCLFSYFIGIA